MIACEESEESRSNEKKGRRRWEWDEEHEGKAKMKREDERGGEEGGEGEGRKWTNIYLPTKLKTPLAEEQKLSPCMAEQKKREKVNTCILQYCHYHFHLSYSILFSLRCVSLPLSPSSPLPKLSSALVLSLSSFLQHYPLLQRTDVNVSKFVNKLDNALHTRQQALHNRDENHNNTVVATGL